MKFIQPFRKRCVSKAVVVVPMMACIFWVPWATFFEKVQQQNPCRILPPNPFAFVFCLQGDTHTQSYSRQLRRSDPQGQVLHLVLWYARLMEDVKGVEIQLDEGTEDSVGIRRAAARVGLELNIQRWFHRTECRRRARPASEAATWRCARWGRPSASLPPLPACSPALPACPPAPPLGCPPATATARLSDTGYKNNKQSTWFWLLSPPITHMCSRRSSWVFVVTLFGPFSVSFIYVEVSRRLGEKL